MTLKEELIALVNASNKTSISDKHRNAVYDYLSERCKSTAKKGSIDTKISIFSSGISPIILSDGSTLTEKDIFTFALEQDLKVFSYTTSDDLIGCYITTYKISIT